MTQQTIKEASGVESKYTPGPHFLISCLWAEGSCVWSCLSAGWNCIMADTIMAPCASLRDSDPWVSQPRQAKAWSAGSQHILLIESAIANYGSAA